MFRLLKIRNIRTRSISTKTFHNEKIGNIAYKIFKKHNIQHAFIYNGGAIMPIIDSLFNKDIKYFVNSNEFCLGSAAVGYAKSSGKIGLAIVTSGPGLTNMVTSITDATNDSTPLVVLSGQVPLNAMGSDAFQECPAVPITESITKWSYCVQTPEEFPFVLDRAFEIANSGKKGAVHIDIPKCISSSVFNYDKVKYEEIMKLFSTNKIDKIKKGNETSISDMCKIINKCK